MESGTDDRVILELGCGYQKHSSTALGIDIVRTPETDLLLDLQDGLPFVDSSADAIYARMVLEHLDARELLAECHRVLKPGGTLTFIVPHPFTTGFWQDPTHVVQPGFTVEGVQYLDPSHGMFYEHDLTGWEVETIDINAWLAFKSFPGRVLSWAFKHLSRLVSPGTREELLKLPFVRGWLEARVRKPSQRGEP